MLVLLCAFVSARVVSYFCHVCLCVLSVICSVMLGGVFLCFVLCVCLWLNVFVRFGCDFVYGML